MQLAGQRGGTPPLLRGKKLGLLRGPHGPDETALFCRAAQELGAHVAILRHGLTDTSPAQEVRDTAQLMGRLYDAIECQGLGRALVQQIQEAAGVPVFDGLGLAGHASSAGLQELEGGESALDKQRFLLQAWLVRVLASGAAP